MEVTVLNIKSSNEPFSESWPKLPMPNDIDIHIHIYRDLFYKHRCTVIMHTSHTNVNPLYNYNKQPSQLCENSFFFPALLHYNTTDQPYNFSTKEPMKTLSIISSVEFTTQSCFHQEVQGLASIEAFLGGDFYRPARCRQASCFFRGIFTATTRGSGFFWEGDKKVMSCQ